MIVEQEYSVKLSEIGRDNKITNKAILGILEDIGGIHSNIAGYGIKDMLNTKLTWVLLEWKLKVIRRPEYAEKIIAKTWSKNAKRCYAFRDFEICDLDGNIIVIASSKWLLINIEDGKIEKISDELLSKYEPELDKHVFEDEEFDKLKEAERYENETTYIVKRADIDVNKHMHNLNYIELAIDALPEEIYLNNQFDYVRITYKKEIKLGEKVKCKYVFKEGKHTIVVKSENDTVLHSIIEMK